MTQNPRAIVRVGPGEPASDGAGVRLTRIVGTRGLDHVDPFLLFDEFGSDRPGDYIAGFPPHPHRGFETVTYMLAGRMRHQDSVGNSGLLTPGAVQWMTAGRGIIHSEMPEQQEGLLWGYQLWVNLPARLKMTAPRYQDIPPERIPEIVEPGRRVRVIAGTYGGVSGAAQSLTAICYLDVEADAGSTFALPLPDGYNVLVYVIAGAVTGNDPLGRAVAVDKGKLAILGPKGEVALPVGAERARFLVIAGQALNEPIARYGPFVMNSRAELMQAAADYQNGTFAQ
jgi:redox-sensitive bicupin YhaK (pirin superfamily)